MHSQVRRTLIKSVVAKKTHHGVFSSVSQTLDAISTELSTFHRKRNMAPQAADQHLESAMRMVQALKNDLQSGSGF